MSRAAAVPPVRPRPESRGRPRRWASALAGLCLVAAGLDAATPPARADEAITPVNSYLVITGSGWGHGIGMSQYGAYGAAVARLSYREILAFYYPGTTLASLKADNTIKVWVSADTDSMLNVVPEKGLRVRDSAGAKAALPTGSKYRQWRIVRSGSKRVLQYYSTAGVWVRKTVALDSGRVWSFDNPTRAIVKLRLPGGGNRDYRGSVALRFYGSGARTVNTVPMEDYLRGVIPSEMPTEWAKAAVQAQSVAARSYAARFQANPQLSIYDLCDTISCQVYQGQDYETSGGNAAVAATADRILKAGSAIALTMFSSSNGGHTASGGTSYLAAKPDPYDGRMKNQKWSTWFSSTAVEQRYPAVGSLRSVRVSARDGAGAWGGRAETVVITGSRGTVSVSGAAFRAAFGLRERLFAVYGGLKPGTGNHERWQGELGGTTGRLGGPSASEVKVAGGLFAPFEEGDLYWSKATGSRRLSGRAASVYRSAGGPAGTLGFPTADVKKTSTGTLSRFQHGTITCLTGGGCTVRVS